MLRALSGKAHLVYTAVVMQQAEQVVTHLAQAEVTFYALTDAEINQYLDTGDYKDKAGAYGIQNEAGAFVEKLNGDYYSIVGFPVGAVREMLKQFS
jgi:septum formation protein